VFRYPLESRTFVLFYHSFILSSTLKKNETVAKINTSENVAFVLSGVFDSLWNAAAKLALVISKAKLSLRIVALLHSPLDTVLFL
jgi:hypothetical protein